MALTRFAAILVIVLFFFHRAAFCDSATTQASSSGLEFHVVADAITANAGDLKIMDKRMEQGGVGPVSLKGDTIRWVEVEYPSEFDRPGAAPETREWKGKHYLPVLITPDASMTRDSGNWNIKASDEEDQDSPAVAFTFDKVGQKLFADLTRLWCKRARQRTDLSDPHAHLAVVLDNRIISAPNIICAITGGSGIITGESPGGFSHQEAQHIIREINSESSQSATPVKP